MATNQHIARRAVLKGAPAAIVAALAAGDVDAAVTALLDPPAETPVMTAYREWQVYRDWLNGPATDGLTNAEFDALCNKRRDMEFAMFALPNAGLRDAALKLVAFCDGGNDLAGDSAGTGELLLREMAQIAVADMRVSEGQA